MKQLKNKYSKNSKGNSSPFALLTVLGILILIFFGLANKQNILDWWALKNYNPPASISTIADQISLTNSSKKVFYVNKPNITSSAEFTKNCPTNSQEKTIILGCYHGNQKGIYLLDVSDPRLEGVEQVTAAHEMLHAEYDRLSSPERDTVNKMLNDYAMTITDQRILDTLEAYKQSEPGELSNEMHSIFGTEIAALPANLEQYYKKYFIDRSQVVAYSQKYQNEFTSRKDKIAADDAQLSGYKNQINNYEDQLTAELNNINALESTMNSYKNSGNYAAYNANVDYFNNMVYAYNRKVNLVQSLINKHNALVAERNAIVLEETQLIQNLQPASKPINQ
jgi:hypothetical protein